MWYNRAGCERTEVDRYSASEANMTVHLYLSLMPEALIASMLTPEEFGVYYAVGSAKKSRGRAMFFEIDPDYRHKSLRIDDGCDSWSEP